MGGSFWLQTELPLMARKDKLDVFWGTMDLIPLALARTIPCVCTVHDLGCYEIPEKFTPYMRLVYRLFFKPSLKAAETIVCTTDSVCRRLKDFGIRGRAEVVPHSVDIERFARKPERADSVLAKYGLQSGYFLYVGHLRPNKNLERTLDAFAQALPMMSGAAQPMLVLAGGRTSTDAAIMERLDSPALRERVKYVGAVPDDDLNALYGSALAFVSPSLYEGFGLPYLEAMAAGLPVIAPRIDTVAEVCGDAARYVEPTSTASIVEAFVELAANAGLRAELSRRSVLRAGEFTWRSAADKLMAVLEAVGAR
jgi:glycosyltransferase involved in cell wall biosynthesis